MRSDFLLTCHRASLTRAAAFATRDSGFVQKIESVGREVGRCGRHEPTRTEGRS